MATFEKGKRVRLNSGGPVMTMESFNSNTGRALCVWFVNDERKSGPFDLASLTDVRDERAPEPPDYPD